MDEQRLRAIERSIWRLDEKLDRAIEQLRQIQIGDEAVVYAVLKDLSEVKQQLEKLKGEP